VHRHLDWTFWCFDEDGDGVVSGGEVPPLEDYVLSLALRNSWAYYLGWLAANAMSFVVASVAVRAGLGRILALYHRPSTLYQIR
jgi:hypothetical protein